MAVLSYSLTCPLCGRVVLFTDMPALWPQVMLKGCEVTPDVVLASGKFGIKLEVPSSEGMSDMIVRCDSVWPAPAAPGARD